MATLTESLLNGVKSLFSGLGAKTTDSNYAVPLVNKSTAEPAGYMEMVNLSAVIAGTSIASLDAAGLDSITASGLYRMNGTSSSFATTDWGIILHYNHNASIAHQIKLCANVRKVLYRKKTSGTWDNWTEIVR